jgi:hypothetical protein
MDSFAHVPHVLQRQSTGGIMLQKTDGADDESDTLRRRTFARTACALYKATHLKKTTRRSVSLPTSEYGGRKWACVLQVTARQHHRPFTASVPVTIS